MKHSVFSIVLTFLAVGSLASAQTVGYTNFIRQIQVSSGVTWQLDTVAPSGAQWSPQTVDSGGSRFELWTVMTSPLTSYLLNSCFVGTYGPVASVKFYSEYEKDGNGVKVPIVRTRADIPFTVDICVSGLLSGLTDPDAAKSVKLYRYVQSYGVGGIGVNIDRSQATLLAQASIIQNGILTLSYPLTFIPGSDRRYVRGEERFSVFSLPDYQVPVEPQIASSYMQVWPMSVGSLAGITDGQKIRFAMPQVTVTLNELYPISQTRVQVYPGALRDGVVGTTVNGSAWDLNETVPQSGVLTLKDYDAQIDSEGIWTMELLTCTIFGTDRLAAVSFVVDRVIKVNSTLTTIE